MSISSSLEITLTCKNCETNLTLEEKNIEPKKIFGNEVELAKIRLIKRAMGCGWLFETKNCTCPQCRTDKGRN